MVSYHFKLYIAGETLKSERVINTVRQICIKAFGTDDGLEIIDVIQQPELAEEAKILATPTLVKEQPLPSRYVVGDFSQIPKVLNALDIYDDVDR